MLVSSFAIWPRFVSRQRVLAPVAEMFRMAVGFEPCEQCADAAMRERDARIRSAIIKIDRVSIGRDCVSTWKHNVLHVSLAFVFRFGRKHPRIAAHQAFFRLHRYRRARVPADKSNSTESFARRDKSSASPLAFQSAAATFQFYSRPTKRPAAPAASACDFPNGADRESTKSKRVRRAASSAGESAPSIRRFCAGATLRLCRRAP